ncbi:bifunctional DNA primase/polymerase [Streptomyces sp. NBC_01218]|uniref:bifunctional DNA primase/polymerase n=1 Tax=Streptomyces sp. NBC_01218 TaxID=2903780 RepID=UPI002E164374|nr:bifunctional DNA primase/polymerase [Streptomyces sp. NBC_01218]
MATTDRQLATLALAHALNAAERGLPVIPLTAAKLPALRSPHPKGSARPACTGRCGRPGHGVHDATTDPTAVRALFAAAPHTAGYGIACGRGPHRLIGIDLDADAVGPAVRPDGHPGAQTDGALRQLALQHLFTIPPTLTVLTPGGGRHLWLTVPTDVVVPSSASRLAPGVDVRGTGGYLIGPGSHTPYGSYRLAPGTANLPPAPCPRTLLRLLTPPVRPAGTAGTAGTAEATGTAGPRPPRGLEQGEGLVHFVRAARAGERNTRLFWAACRAYEHGFGEALAPALTEAAVRAGLAAHEARATLASAARLTAGRSEAA